MKTKVNTDKACYRYKVQYWTGQLVKELNAYVADRNTEKMQKALDSLNYFAKKQIQIERMEEQVKEI
tara:strand:+ start:95 stop:295 length:201 start_codon:yes stop_codon:yes gene_type:complete